MKKIIALILLILSITFVGCNISNVNNTKSTESTTEGTSVNSTKTDKPASDTSNKSTESTFKETEIKEKKIAFTFDDGPAANTLKILDVFKKYNSKATFFVVGEFIEYRKNTLKKIADEGHEIGSHTTTHINLTNLNKKGIINDFNKMKDKIYEYSGYEINLLRPPYGSCNKKLRNVCKKLNAPIIMWDIDTLDWNTRNKKKIVSKILKTAKGGNIILCHDLYDATAAAIEDVVPKLINKGYKLVTVSELLQDENGYIEPGIAYFSKNEYY